MFRIILVLRAKTHEEFAHMAWITKIKYNTFLPSNLATVLQFWVWKKEKQIKYRNKKNGYESSSPQQVE